MAEARGPQRSHFGYLNNQAEWVWGEAPAETPYTEQHENIFSTFPGGSMGTYSPMDSSPITMNSDITYTPNLDPPGGSDWQYTQRSPLVNNTEDAGQGGILQQNFYQPYSQHFPPEPIQGQSLCHASQPSIACWNGNLGLVESLGQVSGSLQSAGPAQVFAAAASSGDPVAVDSWLEYDAVGYGAGGMMGQSFVQHGSDNTGLYEPMNTYTIGPLYPSDGLFYNQAQSSYHPQLCDGTYGDTSIVASSHTMAVSMIIVTPADPDPEPVANPSISAPLQFQKHLSGLLTVPDNTWGGPTLVTTTTVAQPDPTTVNFNQDATHTAWILEAVSESATSAPPAKHVNWLAVNDWQGTPISQATARLHTNMTAPITFSPDLESDAIQRMLDELENAVENRQIISGLQVQGVYATGDVAQSSAWGQGPAEADTHQHMGLITSQGPFEQILPTVQYPQASGYLNELAPLTVSELASFNDAIRELIAIPIIPDQPYAPIPISNPMVSQTRVNISSEEDIQMALVESDAISTEFVGLPEAVKPRALDPVFNVEKENTWPATGHKRRRTSDAVTQIAFDLQSTGRQRMVSTPLGRRQVLPVARRSYTHNHPPLSRRSTTCITRQSALQTVFETDEGEGDDDDDRSMRQHPLKKRRTSGASAPIAGSSGEPCANQDIASVTSPIEQQCAVLTAGVLDEAHSVLAEDDLNGIPLLLGENAPGSPFGGSLDTAPGSPDIDGHVIVEHGDARIGRADGTEFAVVAPLEPLVEVVPDQKIIETAGSPHILGKRQRVEEHEARATTGSSSASKGDTNLTPRRQRTASTAPYRSTQPTANVDCDDEEISRPTKRLCTTAEASESSGVSSVAPPQADAPLPGIPSNIPPVGRSLRNRIRIDYTGQSAQIRAAEDLKLHRIKGALRKKQAPLPARASVAPIRTELSDLNIDVEQEVVPARSKRSAKKKAPTAAMRKPIVADARKRAALTSGARKPKPKPKGKEKGASVAGTAGPSNAVDQEAVARQAVGAIVPDSTRRFSRRRLNLPAELCADPDLR
ncbi:hypothetical protein FRB93_011434 [Tulasnella sp. JGI-2019a]|nr:hypothetical protein FRB93_011434 [Tulasnella sp. JGI-2019a]